MPGQKALTGEDRRKKEEKGMKKWLALLLSSCLMLVSAAGCTLSDVQSLALNSPKEVTDAKGDTDQTIACGDLLFQTSDGFVYEKATEAEPLHTVTEVAYWRYYRDSGEKVKLGTLTNVSGANSTGHGGGGTRCI